MAQRNRPAESSSTSGTAVTLSAEQWNEVVGMLTQGTQLLLSQLAMQPGALPQVAQLSTSANNLLDEIKRQLPQP